MYLEHQGKSSYLFKTLVEAYIKTMLRPTDHREQTIGKLNVKIMIIFLCAFASCNFNLFSEFKEDVKGQKFCATVLSWLYSTNSQKLFFRIL